MAEFFTLTRSIAQRTPWDNSWRRMASEAEAKK
jgi:hypothetical protein